MTVEEKLFHERLKKSIERCEIHLSRIHAAQKYLNHLFPLDIDKYSLLVDDNIAHIDQLIYRFSKLQDEIGANTFRFLLLSLGEDVEGKPFRDMLNRLERLCILDNTDVWMKLREIRNALAHEYPTMVEETIDKLNVFFVILSSLERVYGNINETIRKYNLL